MNLLSTLFSKNLFWDIEESTLDVEKHARFIIERVLMRGRMTDWKGLFQVYTQMRMKREIVKIRYLDAVTLQFCSTFFQLPKSKFKCYKQTPLTQQLWQF
jgi:hypothetical protein